MNSFDSILLELGVVLVCFFVWVYVNVREQLPETKMNAAVKRWHIHRAESIRLEFEGKCGESLYQNERALIAYNEHIMYYHQIESQK
jgi:hypothetical protein